MNLIKQIFNTPWKAKLEIKRIIYHPFILLYLKLNRVKVGKKTKWYGFPKIMKHKNSQVIIGDRVEVRNWRYSNPLGVNHPLILTTWAAGAIINISSDVGISGGSISAVKKINIDKGVLIGANSTITDTDFHPVKSKNRRYQKANIKSSPVYIGENSFLGVNCIVLKGVKLKPSSIIGAGQVVRK